MDTTSLTKKLPQLVKGSSIYKLIVPEKVERKIRYLLRKFPHTEWSGVLFTKHTGTFEGNDLVITCEDVYPMNLGTSGWTEFKMSEDVAAYMAENVKLFDCDLGLVHSHHVLGAFMSGQDMKMVQQEGEDTNCFVSLVVDTRGQYVAIITRKVQTKSEVTIKSLGTSYEFFGEGTKEISHDGTETTKTIDKEVIEYFDLEVERHEVSNDLEYLDARFDEIQKKKAPAKELSDVNAGFRNLNYERQTLIEPELFGKEPSGLSIEDEKKLSDFMVNWRPDAKKIHKAVVSLVTCNLIINPDKLDFKQWVVRHMVNVYRKIFGTLCESEVLDCRCGAFTEYKDFMVQFLIDYFDMDNVPDAMLDNYELMQSRIASAMMEELEPYLKNNIFMQAYHDTLFQYLIE